jgi:hypothetical protein
MRLHLVGARNTGAFEFRLPRGRCLRCLETPHSWVKAVYQAVVIEPDKQQC